MHAASMKESAFVQQFCIGLAMFRYSTLLSVECVLNAFVIIHIFPLCWQRWSFELETSIDLEERSEVVHLVTYILVCRHLFFFHLFQLASSRNQSFMVFTS